MDIGQVGERVHAREGHAFRFDHCIPSTCDSLRYPTEHAASAAVRARAVARDSSSTSVAPRKESIAMHSKARRRYGKGPNIQGRPFLRHSGMPLSRNRKLPNGHARPDPKMIRHGILTCGYGLRVYSPVQLYIHPLYIYSCIYTYIRISLARYMYIRF